MTLIAANVTLPDPAGVVVLWPGRPSPALGLGLYTTAPFGAFVVELVYGVLCWRLYRGGRGLLALVVVGNVANLSLLSVGIDGPEVFLAGRPLVIVSLIAAQIAVTLVLTWQLARRDVPVAVIDRSDSPIEISR